MYNNWKKQASSSPTRRDMLTTVQACECAKEMEKWKSIVRLWYTGLSEGLPEYEN